jgi:hypothetical protein
MTAAGFLELRDRPVVQPGEVGTEALQEALRAIGVREQQPPDPVAVAAQEARCDGTWPITSCSMP